MIYIYAICFMFVSMYSVKHNVAVANVSLYISVGLVVVGTICDTIVKIKQIKYEALSKSYSNTLNIGKGEINYENKSVNQQNGN